MKGVDFSCVSPASTAICSSMDQKSMVRRGMRPVDRYGHYRKTPVPCTSRLPFEPKRYYHMNPGSTSTTTTFSASSSKQSERRADRSSSTGSNEEKKSSAVSASSRFLLLSDKPFEVLSDSDRVKKLQQISNGHHNSPTLKSPSNLSRSRHQVVELRVSIHCKGCEGKLRKHISRMEGVTSFSIDLESKKVTVIGDVTPLGVLASISRVKNAQFWPSPTSSSSSSSPRTSRLSSSSSSRQHP